MTTETTRPRPTPTTRTTSPLAVLAILSAAAFMASMDVFIVNVAFPSIGHDLHGASLSSLSWILSAYAIVYAALLIPLGRLADRYGRRAGFLWGLALFTLASAACATSETLWVLVAFRILQAVGAAALTPTSLGLLIAATPPEHRARSVRTWAATGALASATGPVVGGLLVQASWRWIFLVNVPVGVLALILAARSVPDSRDDSAARIPDLLGAGVLAVAIGALSLGLVEGPGWGWSSARVLGGFALAVIAGAWFVRRTLHHPAPVIAPAVMRVRAFAWANVTAVLFALAFAAALLAANLWLQQVWDYSPLRTGLGISPGPLTVPLFAALAQRLHHRVPPGVLAAAGCAMFGVGTVLILTGAGAHPAYAADFLPGWLIAGAGVGLALSTIMSAAAADLPPASAATGSGVVNTSRQVGTVLGVSVLVAVLGSGHRGYAGVHATFVHAWWVVAAVMVASAVTALGMSPSRHPR